MTTSTYTTEEWDRMRSGGVLAPKPRVEDFDRGYRFRMVQAYPIISGVSDVYEASHEEIDAGFARCLDNSALRRTHDIYLEEQAASDKGPSDV